MTERLLEGKVLLITGGTRGIGRAIALHAADLGANLVVTYRDPAKKARAEELEKETTQRGVSLLVERADITEKADLENLFAQIKNSFGRLDGLILNAAGGLEADKGEDYAMKINRDAQLALIEGGRTIMPAGSWIIYMTSLWAHRYGQLEPLPGYAGVAATKYQAESDLRELIPNLEKDGLKLGIVVGHLIEGTGAYTIFRRKTKGLVEQLAQEVVGGKLPTPHDVAVATLDFFTQPEWPSGQTVYVGEVAD
jgi:NAD(P)-dependent dehydrogenase (short-subunit alcohol dehydrogenase family)